MAPCIGLLLLVLVLSPGIGSQSGQVGLRDAWRAYFDHDHDSITYWIAFQHRLPRTLLAIVAGVTLALCGAVFQTLFRNPLATPYTLGIASGGSLGALIAIKLGLDANLIEFGSRNHQYGISAITIAAFVGAMAVITVIFTFTRGTRRLTTYELLLAGVTLGLFCSAMMMLITYLSDVRETFAIVRWMMGSLDTIGSVEVVSILPFILPAWIVLLLAARPLNQYVLGEELASARGVNVGRLQAVCILFASLATAAVVSVCGPVGFVGLVVPHVTALIVGRDCRILLPAAALIGGVFLAVCDWLSQLAMAWAGALSGRDLGSTILPIGVVTAVVGVPIFLVLLRRRAA
ncbi:MAG: iron ABC transporter permease [Phycisphaerae bacterium]|nr:iron ABC transporter permease [Phycisphaerae bacterium]